MKLCRSLCLVFLAWIFAEAKTSIGQNSNGQIINRKNSNRQNSNGQNSSRQQLLSDIGKKPKNDDGKFSVAITSTTCDTKPANGTKFKNVCLKNKPDRNTFAQKYCSSSPQDGLCNSTIQTNANFLQCYNPGE